MDANDPIFFPSNEPCADPFPTSSPPAASVSEGAPETTARHQVAELWSFARLCVGAGYDAAGAHARLPKQRDYEELSANLDARASMLVNDPRAAKLYDLALDSLSSESVPAAPPTAQIVMRAIDLTIRLCDQHERDRVPMEARDVDYAGILREALVASSSPSVPAETPEWVQAPRYPVWLIERTVYVNKGGTHAEWLKSSVPEVEWTRDASTAMRFETKQEAHQMINGTRAAGKYMGDVCYPTEHVFLARPADDRIQAVRAAAEQMVADSFECGAWNAETDEEPYEPIVARLDKARAAFEAALGELAAAPSVPAEPWKALGFASPEEAAAALLYAKRMRTDVPAETPTPEMPLWLSTLRFRDDAAGMARIAGFARHIDASERQALMVVESQEMRRDLLWLAQELDIARGNEKLHAERSEYWLSVAREVAIAVGFPGDAQCAGALAEAVRSKEAESRNADYLSIELQKAQSELAALRSREAPPVTLSSEIRAAMAKIDTEIRRLQFGSDREQPIASIYHLLTATREQGTDIAEALTVAMFGDGYMLSDQRRLLAIALARALTALEARSASPASREAAWKRIAAAWLLQAYSRGYGISQDLLNWADGVQPVETTPCIATRQRIEADEATAAAHSAAPAPRESAAPVTDEQTGNPNANRLATEAPRATGSDGRAGNPSADNGVSPSIAPPEQTGANNAG